MPADAYASALELVEREREAVRALRPAGTRVVDAHTHLGVDEDGYRLSPEEHVAAMDRNGIEGAIVFALNEPDREPSYRAPNDRVMRWAAESGGRFVPFVRLLLDENPIAEAERCVALGARGIKLHPRAQAFRVNDQRLESVFAFAAEHRLPVLIHAGRGLPAGMAEELGHVADRHPEASLILAHAGIAEQGRIGDYANGHPNIYFDSSTWTPLDILALFAKVGPEQVLYGSDIPYGDHVSSQGMVLRAMRAIGLDDATIRGVMGETARGLVEGRRPERISPPAAGSTLAVSHGRMRVHNYIAAATPLIWLGQADTIGLLGLAEGAARDLDGELPDAANLILGSQALWLSVAAADDAAEAQRRRRGAFVLLNCAQSRALFA
jgi:predicted TIM-barrel fold metal-dependent hydrolase